MRYLKIVIKSTDQRKRKVVAETLRTTTGHEPIIDAEGVLFLQLHTEAELISEVFSLGIAYSELFAAGIDDPFDFEIVQRQVLPEEVAMAMN